jgi:hypothetical protein
VDIVLAAVLVAPRLLSIGGEGLEEGGERAEDAESDEDEGDERPARLEGLVPVAARGTPRC